MNICLRVYTRTTVALIITASFRNINLKKKLLNGYITYISDN